ncbi:MAG: hypothetical protein ACT4QE_25475 [Anaerolineales bacterium]
MGEGVLHLLAMRRYYNTRPEHVTVIEVEPMWETWGEAFLLIENEIMCSW